MTGRVVIVTGANSGIGYETARYLCEGGYDVVLACRDEEKGQDAITRIKRDFPNSLVQCMKLDLSSTTSVREFVKEFTKKKKKLNILINNAGMALNGKDLTRRTTNDNFELTVATNHLGPFLLTNLLLEYMLQTANIMGDGRIINVTCSVHDHENNWSTKGLDFMEADNFQLQKERTYNGLQAYKNSKLCNLLFTYRLAEQIRGSYLAVNAVDPGLVPTTGLYRHASKVSRVFTSCCVHKVMGPCLHRTKSARKAALEVVNLAISEKYEGTSGKFFRSGTEDRSSAESYDPDLQRDIWRMSARLLNIKTGTDDGFDSISLG